MSESQIADAAKAYCRLRGLDPLRATVTESGEVPAWRLCVPKIRDWIAIQEALTSVVPPTVFDTPGAILPGAPPPVAVDDNYEAAVKNCHGVVTEAYRKYAQEMSNQCLTPNPRILELVTTIENGFRFLLAGRKSKL